MNTKLLLFIGTSLSFIPNLTFAQCVATQDCATLGYTETSCNGGKGVKCPFGNKWACLPTKETICKEEGFTLACNGTGQIGNGDSCNGLYKKCSCNSTYKYTCSGTGYAGGSGAACGGKYTACKCASSYEWKDGGCILNGAQGDLYYCNSKVVGVRATGMNFYVAMEDLGEMRWHDDANRQCQNYSFCGNAKGTLPTADQLRSIYNNKSRINTLLSTNGGTEIPNEWYWSSTYTMNEYGNEGYYRVSMRNGYIDFDGFTASGNPFYVRPILTSW